MYSLLFTFTDTGRVSTIAGSNEGFAYGNGSAAKFNKPFGVAIGKDGSYYIADSGNHRIRKISPNGKYQEPLYQ